jgi:hypothetical protein
MNVSQTISVIFLSHRHFAKGKKFGKFLDENLLNEKMSILLKQRIKFIEIRIKKIKRNKKTDFVKLQQF